MAAAEPFSSTADGPCDDGASAALCLQRSPQGAGRHTKRLVPPIVGSNWQLYPSASRHEAETQLRAQTFTMPSATQYVPLSQSVLLVQPARAQ